MGVSVLQPWHVIVILVIVLVIFGPGKLPQLGKAVGETMKDFKKAVSDDAKPEGSATEAPAAAAAPASPTARVVASAPSMRDCATCHKPVPVNDRFCGACGAVQPVPVA
jgi:sec-independent protein translocase protein TatA